VSHRTDVAAQVAATVSLAEGAAGVDAVLGAAARLQPASVRALSRAAALPVPLVSAICNELRRLGVIEPGGPVRLTREGRALVGAAPTGRELERALEAVRPALAEAAREAPLARVELDQSHCTVETKLRRVLAFHEAGALAGKRIVLLGDDDLVSVTLALAVEQLGGALELAGVTVVDVDAPLLAFLDRRLRRAAFPSDLVLHDLRDQLPERLRGAADTVFTDPPYTVAGSALFLSRAVDATGARAGTHVFLAVGTRPPGETLALQRSIAGMGLVVRRLAPNFNEYLGAGVLAGASHLYELVTAPGAHAAARGRHDGPLYTGDGRPTYRLYRCRRCRATARVGRGGRWRTASELKRAGCARCGGDRFAPLARAAAIT
jgi:predicted methyltransferase